MIEVTEVAFPAFEDSASKKLINYLHVNTTKYETQDIKISVLLLFLYELNFCFIIFIYMYI